MAKMKLFHLHYKIYRGDHIFLHIHQLNTFRKEVWFNGGQDDWRVLITLNVFKTMIKSFSWRLIHRKGNDRYRLILIHTQPNFWHDNLKRWTFEGIQHITCVSLAITNNRTWVTQFVGLVTCILIVSWFALVSLISLSRTATELGSADIT